MSSKGVIRSFVMPDGRTVLSIEPTAMRNARQAAKDFTIKNLKTDQGKVVGAVRAPRD